ncbi:MAG TPA: hypothetical protein HA315_03980 [Candidatus Thalassarchaeaceae archaeon]|jgi:metal-responsive CopG/Arc/MetJ family transcriptional regulator|nr:hypothetical protein [Euryarchaeota archaeon]DAC43232.1 MAG TPA: hypothetical protein D7H72_03970 [Candidatus Poseidoniales archaeon]HII35142.1 hypothetical protein [Candidatus Thalassarchaeaceae archaeon]|tara:strand:- start:3924 stop:4349 length:426 start_codon:yes stop_codon:yes gene_type:complete
MSRIVSFSTDANFADRLGTLVEQTGYKNRSMFLRDASIHFAEDLMRGDLDQMEDDLRIEGTTVVYFQHDVENKLAEIRHSGDVDISSYSHTCLPESHSCVDTMQVRGKAGSIRKMITQLRNIHDVDRVVFVSAPDREHGCC